MQLGFCRVWFGLSMPYCVAEQRPLAPSISSVLLVIRQRYNPVPAGIAVVFNVKTMKPHDGLTGNSLNFCPSSILW